MAELKVSAAQMQQPRYLGLILGVLWPRAANYSARRVRNRSASPDARNGKMDQLL